MSKHFGKCALCGKECELSYEHIPPEAAFNSGRSRMYSGEQILFDNDRLPWDVQGLQYVSHQQGSGKYSLCADCNSNTGSWYGDSYKDFAYSIAGILKTAENDSILEIKMDGIYGARFIKQVISMFCSVNNHCLLDGYREKKNRDAVSHSALAQTLFDAQMELYDAAVLVDELRSFVLDKDAIGLDKSKFKICMYATKSNLIKFDGISIVGNLFENHFWAISEITAAPLGFLIYFNPPENLKHIGVDITALADYGYNEKLDIEFPLYILEMNTVLPNDYRTKEQIENCINNSKRCKK